MRILPHPKLEEIAEVFKELKEFAKFKGKLFK